MACNCSGVDEFDLAPLMDILADYRKDPRGALIPVLQKAQGVYGYLPKPILEVIAKELNIPVSEVFGVVTFYSQFHLNPAKPPKTSNSRWKPWPVWARAGWLRS